MTRLSFEDLAASKRGSGSRPIVAPLSRAVDVALGAVALSQTEVAKRLHVSQATISDWRRGEGQPSLAMVLALDDLCGQPRGTILASAGLLDVDATVEALGVASRSWYVVVDDFNSRGTLCRLEAGTGRYMPVARFETLGDAERVAEMWNERAHQYDAEVEQFTGMGGICHDCHNRGCTLGGLQFEAAAVGDGVATFVCDCECHTLTMRVTDWLERWPGIMDQTKYTRQLIEDLWAEVQP